MFIWDWAARWGIPHEAIEELRQLPQATLTDGQSETATQSRLRMMASQAGAHLWRNNNGAAQDPTGRWIRYGLGNDSARINAQFKSSDLIGITPVNTPVGRLGVFTAIECKHPGWRAPENERDVAQERFLNAVRAAGGIGAFITHPDQYHDQILR